MEQIQIKNKKIKLLNCDELVLNNKKKRNKKVLVNKIMLIALILVIIYILLPKFNFINQIPRVGSIVTKDIISDYDVLVKDENATKFKIDRALSKLGVFLDYDPLPYQRLIEKITYAFDKSEEKRQQLKQQVISFDKDKNITSKEYFVINQKLALVKKNKSGLLKYIDYLDLKEGDSNIEVKQLNQKIEVIKIEEETLNKEVGVIDAKLQSIKKTSDDFYKNISLNVERNLEILLQDLGLNFDAEILTILTTLESYTSLKLEIIKALQLFDRSHILANKNILSNTTNKDLKIFNLETDSFLQNSTSIQFIDLKDAKSVLNKYLQESGANTSLPINTLTLLITEKLLIPTVFENKQKLDNSRKEINSKSNSVFINIKKGEVLIKKGENFAKEKVNLIYGYFAKVNEGKGITYSIAIVTLLLLVLSLIFVFLKLERKSIEVFYENVVILLVSLAINLIIIFLVKEVFELFSSRYSLFSLSSYVYALPVTLGVMLCGALTNFRVNLPNAFLSSLCVTLYLEENLHFFIFCWLSSNFTCLLLTNINTRFDFLKKGALVSVFNMVALFILESLNFGGLADNIIESVIFAFIGGILATIFNIILLPLFEQIFGISTQLKLLELSNLNHPLLKYLQNKAPGTYQHAIIVGSLSESGAQKVGANPLLAKIGAYYHDIGKAVEPQYFNENYTFSKFSPHDKITPQESAKKIINHVIYGVQLAKKFKLGNKIVDIIASHHGNSLIKFFYNKMCNQQKKKEIPKENFCYPASRPTSIEATIVMLADCCEVMVRSLKECNLKTITSTVTNVFQNVTDNYQLDNSDINIIQLRKLREVFIDIFISLNHDRYLGKSN